MPSFGIGIPPNLLTYQPIVLRVRAGTAFLCHKLYLLVRLLGLGYLKCNDCRRRDLTTPHRLPLVTYAVCVCETVWTRLLKLRRLQQKKGLYHTASPTCCDAKVE
eukprot:scaffold160148_cov31-Tisochrysis_lutea.AAC.1